MLPSRGLKRVRRKGDQETRTPPGLPWAFKWSFNKVAQKPLVAGPQTLVCLQSLKGLRPQQVCPRLLKSGLTPGAPQGSAGVQVVQGFLSVWMTHAK